MKLLLECGADPKSINALHAAAFGGSDCGSHPDKDYPAALRLLLDAGADINDRRYHDDWTPLKTAMDSGNREAIEFLLAQGAAEI